MPVLRSLCYLLKDTTWCQKDPNPEPLDSESKDLPVVRRLLMIGQTLTCDTSEMSNREIYFLK